MELSSRIYTSPSFNTHSSNNNIIHIADRIAHEFRLENGFNDDDDAFSFSDDDHKNTDIADGNSDKLVISNTHTDEDEREFEFPVMCGDSNSRHDSDDKVVIHNDQISPPYPFFDRSLLSEIDVNDGVDTPKTESKRSPSNRSSLGKLLSEARETTSTSSSEDLDGITPGTYCVWKPKTEPRGKHKKSNSISIGNTSNRWKVPDLLKRSFSDDNYTVGNGKDSPVLLFVPPISQKKNEKGSKIEKFGRMLSSPVGGGVPLSTKSEKKAPAYKGKIGNIHLPPYLPYRQGQDVGAFTPSNKHISYRY